MLTASDIAARIKACGKTQTELAKSAGCSQPVVQRLASGQSGERLDQHLRILTALGYRITAPRGK